MSVCLLSSLLIFAGACAGGEGPAHNPSDSGADAGLGADTVDGANQAPQASISAPSQASVGQRVDLDASASVDPDGDELDFVWRFASKPDGSQVVIWGDRSANSWFQPDVVGQYLLELTVDDGQAESTETFTITVDDSPIDTTADAGQDVGQDTSDEVDAGPNHAPVADAGADITADVGTQLTLDGSNSSDPDGDALTYRWTMIAEPTGNTSALLGSDSATPRFTPSVEGDYAFELTVDDGELTSSDSVVVRVGEGGGNDGGGGDDGGTGGNDGGGHTGGGGADCLIISEYVEGSSYNKAIEIYNCGSAAIDLTDYRYCAAHNSTDPTGTADCSRDHDLTGTLAAGAVQVLCNDRISDAAACDELTGNISFNGDDRFVIYLDDGSGAYEHGVDTVVDAFGELASEPSSRLWADVTLERCNFAPFDGVSSFDAAVFYTTHAEDDFSGLGAAPSETCAP
ncbi:lamin tail domain-containing protein [Persicimonas caeni]|uniref:lamin tail domain-containing protein n=1 Tax=Persicimonas caeni TaxID=2292766 RepID=UPI00164CE64B|nr:lamin tail domain-containing protein [Persicimonas caeni]